jgi:hypothetical protein
MRLSDLSKSKLLAVILLCVYIIGDPTGSYYFPAWYWFCPPGLLSIWIGEKYGVTRVRKHGVPHIWTLNGWILMLYPIFWHVHPIWP